ncbi:uncharacterized protein [Epargyreus clarus]|uniref:uncharacterized protein n=1 Tax=Epargyreus clarus TaxID=520877 RepID=UPI003C309EFC
MNYKERCRTCLGKGKEMRHIHTVISIAGEGVRLSDILDNFYHYKISPEDQFPENICINCVYQLTITYSFKVLIENSAKSLEESYTLDSTSDNYDLNFESDDHKVPTCNSRVYQKKVRSHSEPTHMNLVFCVECKAEFHNIKTLSEHCTTNHPVKSAIGRSCDYCPEKFDDFRSLVRHRKLHLKPYLCENCWEGFISVSELNNHACQPSQDRGKIKAERVLRQCDQCGKSYPPGYIRIHMLTHSNDRPYACKYCPKKFKVPGSLNSHILWNHKRTRNHKCEVCNATFISSSARSSHIRKNHLKEKKYGCENCGKRFFSKSELQRHSLTHTGVKNFHCHMCDKSYQTRYGLNVHLKSHTQISINVLNL